MKKLVISRKDLKNNLKIIRKILNSPGKDDSGNVPEIIAVVKGNGMGLDLIAYAKFLENQGINFLAVANIEEAVQLRKAGIKNKILMMTPVFSEKEILQMFENDVIFTVSSLEQIQKIEEICASSGKSVQAHLKIDTGFGRYGFLYMEENMLLEAFEACCHISITGTYTHFARPLDEKFTNLQFERFLNCVRFLKQNGQDTGMLHAAESTAMLKYPMMNLNAVRIGSALQGRVLVGGSGLVKIGSFQATIQEIKTVPKGYNISYGKMYKTRKKTKIAVIPVRLHGWMEYAKRQRYFFIKRKSAFLRD